MESEVQSWRVDVNTAGDPPDSWACNALRFADRGEAERYALDLAIRWTAVRDWRVVASPEEPNR